MLQHFHLQCFWGMILFWTLTIVSLSHLSLLQEDCHIWIMASTTGRLSHSTSLFWFACLQTFLKVKFSVVESYHDLFLFFLTAFFLLMMIIDFYSDSCWLWPALNWIKALVVFINDGQDTADTSWVGEVSSRTSAASGTVNILHNSCWRPLDWLTSCVFLCVSALRLIDWTPGSKHPGFLPICTLFHVGRVLWRADTIL